MIRLYLFARSFVRSFRVEILMSRTRLLRRTRRGVFVDDVLNRDRGLGEFERPFANVRQRENRVGRSSDDPALRTEGEFSEHDLNAFVGDLSGGVGVASVFFLTRRSVSGSDADEDAL